MTAREKLHSAIRIFAVTGTVISGIYTATAYPGPIDFFNGLVGAAVALSIFYVGREDGAR